MSSLVTILKGFKLRPSTLDTYLTINKDYESFATGTCPPQYEYGDGGTISDKASRLLHARAAALGGAGNCGRILVVVPFVEPHDQSPWVYVAFSYRFVYSQVPIAPNPLPKEDPPLGFQLLRQDIFRTCELPPDSAGQFAWGIWVVVTENRSCPIPAALREKHGFPISCVLCDKTFQDLASRFQHAKAAHGVDESAGILPENA